MLHGPHVVTIFSPPVKAPIPWPNSECLLPRTTSGFSSLMFPSPEADSEKKKCWSECNLLRRFQEVTYCFRRESETEKGRQPGKVSSRSTFLVWATSAQSCWKTLGGAENTFQSLARGMRRLLLYSSVPRHHWMRAAPTDTSSQHMNPALCAHRVCHRKPSGESFSRMLSVCPEFRAPWA